MNIEVMQVEPEKWVALSTDLDPRVPHEPLVTGKTEKECLKNLGQWIKDRTDQGLTAGNLPAKKTGGK
jgi:hypothetical protein